jgi:hypothetical protein
LGCSIEWQSQISFTKVATLLLHQNFLCSAKKEKN